MVFNNFGTNAVRAAGLGQPPKGVNYHFSWPKSDKPYVVEKLSISEAKYAVLAGLAKRKITALLGFCLKT